MAAGEAVAAVKAPQLARVAGAAAVVQAHACCSQWQLRYSQPPSRSLLVLLAPGGRQPEQTTRTATLARPVEILTSAPLCVPVVGVAVPVATLCSLLAAITAKVLLQRLQAVPAAQQSRLEVAVVTVLRALLDK